jgi:Spy/CpxP family protein refolding chaperone
MKTRIKALAGAATIFLSALAPQASTAQNPSPDAGGGAREKLLMDFGWKFHLGNEWGIGPEPFQGRVQRPARPARL